MLGIEQPSVCEDLAGADDDLVAGLSGCDRNREQLQNPSFLVEAVDGNWSGTLRHHGPANPGHFLALGDVAVGFADLNSQGGVLGTLAYRSNGSMRLERQLIPDANLVRSPELLVH